MIDKTNIPNIDVRDLSFAYNGLEALKGLSLEVRRGEFVGFLGPNGSGKTTLVKLLSGVLKPGSGSIGLMGKALENWSARALARRMAVVPQSTYVAFPFSALEVVLMGRSPHLGGWAFEGKADMESARHAMELTGTWELRNRAMGQLSGGEAQRVIVARALAQNPNILLLDEPTQNLDIKRQIELMEILARLNKEDSLTILIVSHDLNLVSYYVDRVVLLMDGSIYTDGPPKEALTPENIRLVYDASVEVMDINGRPGIFPAINKLDGGDI